MYYVCRRYFSSSAAIPAQGFYQQRRADMLELAQALQSGDLSGAQKVFSALAALSLNGSNAAASSTAAAATAAASSSTAATSSVAPSSTSTSSTASSTSGPFSNSQLNKDFNAIGQALQSGDLAGAQSAFATFQQDLQNVRGGSRLQSGGGQVQASGGRHHHHYHHHGSGQSSSASSPTPGIILNLGNSSNSGSGEQISLSFANNGSNGEQLTIGVSNGSGSPEQITVNFGSGSNPDIILNLGNNGSAAASTATTTPVAATSGQLNVSA
jgi:hypothetical protein